MNITLDIETLPSEDDAVREEIAAGIKPPGNMKLAATIQKWEEEEKPALVDQAMLKTSFDASYGSICCIGWAIDDEKPRSLAGGMENSLLFGFFSALSEEIEFRYQGGSIERPVIFIGHNISGFDLRFLWQRAVINKLKMPPSIVAAVKAKPWDKIIADTMIMWNPDQGKRISLDRLCRVLRVQTSKGDMDGSKVYETYKAGDLDKIATYCREDVRATRECFQMMT